MTTTDDRKPAMIDRRSHAILLRLSKNTRLPMILLLRRAVQLLEQEHKRRGTITIRSK